MPIILSINIPRQSTLLYSRRNRSIVQKFVVVVVFLNSLYLKASLLDMMLFSSEAWHLNTGPLTQARQGLTLVFPDCDSLALNSVAQAGCVLPTLLQPWQELELEA